MTMHKEPCAACMNRRQFLSSAATASAGLVVMACGDGLVSGIAPVIISPPNGPLTIKVGDHAELATNGTFARVFNIIAVRRTGETTFDAISLVCTHEGCEVGITSSTQLDCPCHFSRFDGNGAVLRGPAKRPLARYNTSYDAATDILTIG